MSRTRSWLLLATVGIGVVIALFIPMEAAPDECERAGYYLDGEEELGPVGIPDGEWWGSARDFLVLIKMDQASGVAGVATKNGDFLFDVAITYPDVRIRPDLAIPNIDKPIYVFESRDHLSTWNVRVPEPPSASDVFDQLIVESIHGSFGAGQPLFRLFRTETQAPGEHCDAKQRAILERLRRIVSNLDKK